MHDSVPTIFPRVIVTSAYHDRESQYDSFFWIFIAIFAIVVFLLFIIIYITNINIFAHSTTIAVA
jgi:hypothetical protein